MEYSFDGANKIINIVSGTSLDVRDLYSRWKDWALTSGSNYKRAFYVVGGDPVDETLGIYISSYFYLDNGWRIKPMEADHKLGVSNGVLLTIEGDNPFLQTEGYYNVVIDRSLPIKSETINIGGGGASTTDIWSNTIRTLTEPPPLMTDTYSNVGYISSQIHMMSSQIASISGVAGLEDVDDEIGYVSSQILRISSQISNIKLELPPNLEQIINQSSRGL